MDIWHSSNLAEPEYLSYLPTEYVGMWDEAALAWLETTYHSDQVEGIVHEYIDIFRKLKDKPVGPTRSRLVRRAAELEKAEVFGCESGK